MDYSGELAAIQQELARSVDMALRRRRVIDALGAAPGERVLDAGCGGGALLREVGLVVGETGSALGIDLSPDQVAAARAHCADVTQVGVEVGDVLAIPAADEDFDAVLSTQVLEYVVAVEAAVAELWRVSRPGGRFINVATNWGSLFLHGGDPRLTERIVTTWERHAPHPDLPVALPGMLTTAGFDAVGQEPVTIMNRRFEPGTYGHGAARLMAAFAVVVGDLDDGDAGEWLDSLERADVAGDYFVSVVPVITTATRPV